MDAGLWAPGDARIHETCERLPQHVLVDAVLVLQSRIDAQGGGHDGAVEVRVADLETQTAAHRLRAFVGPHRRGKLVRDEPGHLVRTRLGSREAPEQSVGTVA